MARVSTIVTNFRAGELSPRLEGRIDLEKYNEGAQTLQNMLVFPQGGTTRRPGTYYAGSSKDGGKIRLINFEFSDEQAYVLEFGENYIRVYKDGGIVTEATKAITAITSANPAVVTSDGHGYSNGDRVFISGVAGMTQVNNREFTVAGTATNTFQLSGVNSSGFTSYGSGGTAGKIVEIVTTYTEAQVFELNYTQSADVIFLAHKSHEPAKLTRTSAHAGWDLSDIDFVDGPYLDENITDTTIYSSANTGSVTLTASADLFAATDVGRLVRLREVIEVQHDAWATSTSYSQNALVRFGDNVYKKTDSGSDTSGLTPPVHITGSETYGPITWAFQHSGTGFLKITAFTNATTVTALFKNSEGVLPASVVTSGNATTRWSLGSFGGTEGQPRAVGFYEQRLYFAGTTGKPQTIFGSTSADFENHTPATLDDSAVNFTISSDKVNVIKHLLPARFLQILTSSAEFTLSGGQGTQPVTPTNVNILRETTFGTSEVRPLRAGNSTILIQKGQEKVKEITFDLDTDGLLGVDLSILADHILRGGVSDMVWQQEPELILWFVHTDGRLIGLTYDRANNAVGWHTHPLGGKFGEATLTVSDYANIATGTTITLTKSDGESVVFTSEAAGGTDPADTSLGWRPNESNNTTADNIFTRINAHADFTVTNPAAAVVTIIETAPENQGFLTVATSDSTRLAPTSQGSCIVESITSVPEGSEDTVYMSVKRTIDGSTVRHICFMKAIFFGTDGADAFYVDSGLTYSGAATTTISSLNHLEGETVAIVADGSTHADKIVTGGAITLDRSATKVHIGYNYTSILETLRLEAGADDGISQGKVKRIHGVTVRFLDSIGAEVGPNLSNLDRLPFRDSSMAMDEPVPLFSGDKEVYFPSGYDNDARIIVRQNQPLPMTVLAVMRRSNTFDA
tara:strand:- start:1560 stop:4298 length:2739 start_codon:yes stop_codon:yes gene_type:complete